MNINYNNVVKCGAPFVYHVCLKKHLTFACCYRVCLPARWLTGWLVVCLCIFSHSQFHSYVFQCQCLVCHAIALLFSRLSVSNSRRAQTVSAKQATQISSIYLFAYLTQAKTQTSKWSNIKTSSKRNATIHQCEWANWNARKNKCCVFKNKKKLFRSLLRLKTVLMLSHLNDEQNNEVSSTNSTVASTPKTFINVNSST